jgi:hypothetical protein
MFGSNAKGNQSEVPERTTIALLANIRLGWKGMLGANSLAYFVNSFTTVKSFITLGPDDDDWRLCASSCNLCFVAIS